MLRTKRGTRCCTLRHLADMWKWLGGCFATGPGLLLSGDMVEILLQNAGNINPNSGPYGESLQAAAYRGNDAVVELLLEKDANVKAQGGTWGCAL